MTSFAATKDDIALLRKDMNNNFEDILALLQIFMVQVDERFNKTEHKLAETKHQILNQLDGMEKRLEINEHERFAMASQLTRHDTWIHGIAKKVSFDLPP